MISSVMSSWALATWDHFAWPFSILLWTLESRTGQRDGVKARTLSTKTKSQTANTFSLAWKLEHASLKIIDVHHLLHHHYPSLSHTQVPNTIVMTWSALLDPRVFCQGFGQNMVDQKLKPYPRKARCNQHFAKSGAPIPRYSPYAPSALATDLGIDMYQPYQRWVPRREVLCDAARGSYPLSNLRLRPGDIPTLKPTSFSFFCYRSIQREHVNSAKKQVKRHVLNGLDWWHLRKWKTILKYLTGYLWLLAILPWWLIFDDNNNIYNI